MPTLKAVLRRWGLLRVRSLLCRWSRAEKLPPAELHRRWREARRLLLLCGAGIGDAVMALPLLQVLRQRRPELQLTVVARAHLQPFFEVFPWLRLLTYGEGWQSIPTFLRLLWRCWRLRADAFLGTQPANTVRHALIAAASRAPLRLKHAYGSVEPERDFSCLYHLLLPIDLERHRVEHNLDLLRSLGETIPEGHVRPQYPVPESLRRRAESLLPTEGPWVALHPGGGRAEKRWPLEHFLALARLLRRRGYYLVLLGGLEEKALGSALWSALGEGTVNLVGMLNVAESAAVLQRCRLLVSNDSGIMHVATAVGTPVVAIFLRTHPAHVGPYTPMATVVGTGSGSIPTVDEVWRAILPIMSTPAPEH